MGGVTALTDENGFFTIRNIPVGYYSLQVVHRNFQVYGMSLGIIQNIAYNMAEPIRIMSVVRPL